MMNDDLENIVGEKIQIVEPSDLNVLSRIAKKKAVGLAKFIPKTLAAYLPHEIYCKIIKNEDERFVYFISNIFMDIFLMTPAKIYAAVEYGNSITEKIIYGGLAFTSAFGTGLRMGTSELDNKQKGSIVLSSMYHLPKLPSLVKKGFDYVLKKSKEEYDDKKEEIVYQRKEEVVRDRVGGALVLTEGLEGGELSETDERAGGISPRSDYDE